jgi:hypothetical protein
MINRTASLRSTGRPRCGLARRLLGEQGAQLVEFALVLPLLLTLLLGIITGGIAFSRSIAVDNAAREAARYAATLPVDTDMSTWLNDVADVAIRSATGDMDIGEQGREICVAYVYPAGSDPTDQTTRIFINAAGARVVTVGSSCYGDGRPNDERRVQVLLERESDLVLALWDRTLTLEGESTVRFERGD